MTFTYDNTNRMSQAVNGAVTTNYKYDGKGQRVVKNTAGTITLFIFDKDGSLIAEADGGGVVQRDYVYFGGRPVALATVTGAPAVFYYHVDHLGSPQVLTNQLGTVVWAGDYGVFGEVNLTTNTIENNLRFPGQYYDSETGLHYNYFRDYDPALGRYTQSDPIGLAGGLNTFAYVYANPLKFYDDLGLECIYVGRRNETSREFTTTREELISSTKTKIPGPRPLQPQDCFPVPGPDTKPGRIPRGFPCGLPIGQWLVVTDIYQQYTISHLEITAIGVYQCTDDCGNVTESLVPINEDFTTEETSGVRIEVTNTPLF